MGKIYATRSQRSDLPMPWRLGVFGCIWFGDSSSPWKKPLQRSNKAKPCGPIRPQEKNRLGVHFVHELKQRCIYDECIASTKLSESFRFEDGFGLGSSCSRGASSTYSDLECNCIDMMAHFRTTRPKPAGPGVLL